VNQPSAMLTPPTPIGERPPAPGDTAAPASNLAPLRSSLRWPAAAAALVTAAAHLPVIPQHLTEVPYIGWLFIGLTAVCVLGAIALTVYDSAVTWTILAASCLAAAAGYLLSRGPGLPGMPDDIGDWTNPLGLISILTESLVVLLALGALHARRAAHQVLRATTILVGSATILTIATFLIGIAAS
jgi:hypothetical protein